MYEVPVRTRPVCARGPRRGTVSVTSTLETALAGLPAKPRVHELSKRMGMSNKDMIAALAERGVEVKSASASVPLAIAQELIEALIGGAAAAGAQPAQDSPPEDAPTATVEPPTAERSPAAAIPGDTP